MSCNSFSKKKDCIKHGNQCHWIPHISGFETKEPKCRNIHRTIPHKLPHATQSDVYVTEMTGKFLQHHQKTPQQKCRQYCQHIKKSLLEKKLKQRFQKATAHKAALFKLLQDMTFSSRKLEDFQRYFQRRFQIQQPKSRAFMKRFLERKISEVNQHLYKLQHILKLLEHNLIEHDDLCQKYCTEDYFSPTKKFAVGKPASFLPEKHFKQAVTAQRLARRDRKKQ